VQEITPACIALQGESTSEAEKSVSDEVMEEGDGVSVGDDADDSVSEASTSVGTFDDHRVGARSADKSQIVVPLLSKFEAGYIRVDL